MAEAPKRAWLAAVLAALHPGLGHLYIGAWPRAILWFGSVVITAVIFVPDAIIAEISAIGDIPEAAAELPLEAALALAGVVLINVLDAYMGARRLNVEITGPRCQACGRKLDEELTFCHWCTTERPETEPPEQSPE